MASPDREISRRLSRDLANVALPTARSRAVSAEAAADGTDDDGFSDRIPIRLAATEAHAPHTLYASGGCTVDGRRARPAPGPPLLPLQAPAVQTDHRLVRASDNVVHAGYGSSSSGSVPFASSPTTSRRRLPPPPSLSPPDLHVASLSVRRGSVQPSAITAARHAAAAAAAAARIGHTSELRWRGRGGGGDASMSAGIGWRETGSPRVTANAGQSTSGDSGSPRVPANTGPTPSAPGTSPERAPSTAAQTPSMAVPYSRGGLVSVVDTAAAADGALTDYGFRDGTEDSPPPPFNATSGDAWLMGVTATTAIGEAAASSAAAVGTVRGHSPKQASLSRATALTPVRALDVVIASVGADLGVTQQQSGAPTSLQPPPSPQHLQQQRAGRIVARPLTIREILQLGHLASPAPRQRSVSATHPESTAVQAASPSHALSSSLVVEGSLDDRGAGTSGRHAATSHDHDDDDRTGDDGSGLDDDVDDDRCSSVPEDDGSSVSRMCCGLPCMRRILY